MTTSMQDLINWVKEYVDHYQMYPNDWEVTHKAKFLLEKEKQQMEACYNNGYVEGVSQQAGLSAKYENFKDYYTKIFNNNATERE